MSAVRERAGAKRTDKVFHFMCGGDTKRHDAGAQAGHCRWQEGGKS